jgi:hypothetical protein
VKAAGRTGPEQRGEVEPTRGGRERVVERQPRGDDVGRLIFRRTGEAVTFVDRSQSRLLDVGEDRDRPRLGADKAIDLARLMGVRVLLVRHAARAWPPRSERKGLLGSMVGVEGDADLPEVVLASRPTRGRAGLLDGGHDEAHERGDDRHDDEQFDEAETAVAHTEWCRGERPGPAGRHGLPRLLSAENEAKNAPEEDHDRRAGCGVPGDQGPGNRHGPACFPPQPGCAGG